MTRATLICSTCGHTARRSLLFQPGSRGVHETDTEEARCPKGHGPLVRARVPSKNRKYNRLRKERLAQLEKDLRRSRARKV